MKDKKTIFILTPFFSPNLGGVESYLDDMCSVLTRKGYPVFVLTYQPMARALVAPAIEKNGLLTIRRLSWFGRKGDFFHRLARFPVIQFFYIFSGLGIYSFYFLMKFRTLDIIHAQGITAAFIGKFLKKIFRKKLIVNIHSVYDQKILSSVQVRFVSWILNGADHVFVLSKAIWAQHVNYFKILPERISRFRYWLDLSIFHPIASGQKPIASWQGKFVVLFVGRLLSIKGVDLLFEMVEKLPSDIYIAMVGEGSRRAELEHKSKAFSQVMFVGPVRNQDLPAYLWSADLLIMPSLYKEGYGRVNMEAQACGLPILASNRGGIGEVVQEGGILVEPTVQNFIEKVLELKNNPQKLADLRQKAIRFAEANFSEKNIEVFENYYNQL